MAMQIRRGTNRDRLGITPVEGEVLYVTDFKLTTIEVTSINVTTNVLTTTLGQSLIAGQRIRFIGPENINGITTQGVYYIKTVPDATNFTLSTTLNGTTLDITGTSGTVSIDFAVGPTDALGVPVGTTVSPIWVGDGLTAGGNPGGATVLDDLYDVEIGIYGNVNEYGVAIDDGQMLAFNEVTGVWENVHTIAVANYAQTINHQREIASTALNSTTLNAALRITKRITDSASPADLGGPGIAFNAVGTDNTNHTVALIGATFNSNLQPDVLLQTTTNGSTFVSTIASSQQRTDINQGVLYVNKTISSIGINNTSPAYSLDVTGNVHATGATTLDNTLFVGNTITTNNGTILTNSGTATVMNTNAATVNAFGAATNMTLGATTGTTTIRNASTVITGDLTVNGGDIVTNASTGTVFNTTASTVNIAGAATAVNIGSTTGTTTVKNDLSVNGNLSVFGTTTNIDTTNLVIEDNLITLNKNETGAGVSAGFSGIEIERGTQANVNWQFNESSFTWETTNNSNIYGSGTIVASSILGTNGNQITFNNDDGAAASSYLTVKRGTGVDVSQRWYEPSSRWQFTNNGSNYYNQVITLDDLNDVVITTPGRGTFLKYDGTNWVNGSTIEFDNTNFRPKFVNNVETGVTAAEFLKRTSNTTLFDGDQVGLVLGAISTDDTKGFMHRILSTRNASGHNIIIQSDNTGDFSATTTTVKNLASLSVEAVVLNTDVTYICDRNSSEQFAAFASGGSSISTDLTIGNSTNDNLTVISRITNNLTFNTTDAARGITGTTGTNDDWFIGGGATGIDSGYITIATANDGTEPIYVRQYAGSILTGTVANQATLLDASGNTIFPNSLTALTSLNTGNAIVMNQTDVNIGANSTITVRRGQLTDATLTWEENNTRWAVSNGLHVNGNITLNGESLIFNADDTPGVQPVITMTRNGATDATISWNNTTSRIEFNLPITTATGTGLRVSQDLYGTDLHGFLVSGSTGNVITGGNIYLNRSNSAYNGGSANAAIVVDRIATDASITWTEATTSWDITNNINGAANINAASMSVDNVSVWDSSVLSTTSTTTTNLHTFNIATYRSSKYTVQITSGANYQVIEMMVLHNGTSGFITTYGDLNTGVNLATFDADVSAGLCRLRITPTTATLTEFKVDRTLIVV